MTYRQQFEEIMGIEAVKKLPANWKRHIRRIDNLPKPKKNLSVRQILKAVGG